MNEYVKRKNTQNVSITSSLSFKISYHLNKNPILGDIVKFIVGLIMLGIPLIILTTKLFYENSIPHPESKFKIDITGSTGMIFSVLTVLFLYNTILFLSKFNECIVKTYFITNLIPIIDLFLTGISELVELYWITLFYYLFFCFHLSKFI